MAKMEETKTVKTDSRSATAVSAKAVASSLTKNTAANGIINDNDNTNRSSKNISKDIRNVNTMLLRTAAIKAS